VKSLPVKSKAVLNAYPIYIAFSLVAQFFAFSNEIVVTTEGNSENIFGQLRNLATAVTSHAIEANETWPNVTLPHFDLRAREAEELSGLELIVFSPLVTEANRAGWEEYAWQHQDWIAEDLNLYDDQGGSVFNPGSIARSIYKFSDETDEDGAGRRRLITEYDQSFYVPVWQLGPVPTNASIINLDLHSHPELGRTMNDVLEIEHKLLSGVVDVDFLLDYAAVEKVDENPRSFILQPIFQSFAKSAMVTGFLVGELAWDSFFVDVLPVGTGDVLVNVRGTCGNEFSYAVRGHKAIYYGDGDLHDAKYDSLKYTSEFAEFARYDGEADDDLRGIHCEYSFEIYPTEALESQYRTNGPAIFTTIVVVVFLFTALIFALYDYLVSHAFGIALALRNAMWIRFLFSFAHFCFQSIQTTGLQAPGKATLHS